MQSKAEEDFVRSSIKLLRADGRDASQFRKRFVQENVSPLANGSARVQVGGTVVVAGVRVEIEECTGGGGRVGIDVELAAAAAATSTLSDPSATIQTFLASLYTPSTLHLPMLTQTRRLAVTIHVIILSTDGGSVLDVCCDATSHALKSTRIPKINVGVYKDEDAMMEDGDVWKKEMDGEIELLSHTIEEGDLLSDVVPSSEWPMVATLHLAEEGDNVFVDADAEEERASVNRVSIASRSTGPDRELCGVMWEGEGEVDFEKVKDIISRGSAIGRGRGTL